MTQIKDALIDFNPWWKNEFELEYKPRSIYSDIKKVLKLPQIISLTGLRRVGKTTIMLKIADDYINSKFNPKHIIYFSFDEFRDKNIRDVIKEYEHMFGFDINSGKYLLLLDEVQKLNDWENQVKTIYDIHKERIKIIISGSESLFLRKKSKETLAGRLFEFKINPLSFKEYIQFKGKNYAPSNLYSKELLQLFEEYIKTSGFPEMIGIKNKSILNLYIKEGIIDRIVYKDIPQLFDVRDPSILESILKVFLDDPGQLIDLVSFAKDLNISRHTLSNYLDYLEKSYLIRKLYNFSKNNRKVERKLKKYYPIINSISLAFKQDLLSKSKLFESVVVNQLDAGFFWRDPYKNEVDIVLTDGNIKPIEVKYGKITTKGLLKFMNKFDVSKGTIISYDKEDVLHEKGKIINVIPAYKYFIEL